MSYKMIDFNKPQYIEVSRNGEQVIAGIKVQGAMLGQHAPYINLTQESPIGLDNRIPLSPSQARSLGAMLINFANQEEHGNFKPDALEFNVPAEHGLDPHRPTPEHKWFIDRKSIGVRFSKYGLTLNQDSSDYLRPNAVDAVHLSNTQLESLLGQAVKHSPKFRKLLETILAETI